MIKEALNRLHLASVELFLILKISIDRLSFASYIYHRLAMFLLHLCISRHVCLRCETLLRVYFTA